MDRGHLRARSEQFSYQQSHNFPHSHPPSMRSKEPRDLTSATGLYRFNGSDREREARDDERTWPGQAQGPPQLPALHALHPPASPGPSATDLRKAPTYDASRRRSLGAQVLFETPAHHTIYDQRAMPPPSPPPPALQPAAISPSTTGANGPPTTSPFTGIRDLANLSSTRRHGTGMSISSMLGGPDDRKPHTSPHTMISHSADTSRNLRPHSPGRARAASMREPYRGYHDRSPSKDMSSAPAPHSEYQDARFRSARDDPFGPSNGHDNTNGFRTYFGPPQNDAHQSGNTYGLPGRPSSQPVGQPSSLLPATSNHNDEARTARVGTFRSFGNASDAIADARETSGYGDGDGSRAGFRELAEYRHAAHDASIMPGLPATLAQEEPALHFRPTYTPQQNEYQPRGLYDGRSYGFREAGRTTPPEMYRSTSYDRPLTYEEHQRMEAGRDYHRKDSDGYTRRSVFNISPEVMRRGRDSPLPQAVQGARSRHIGPGGDHPGIKTEFGRMFSGLGSGAGQSANGNTTPSRVFSPANGDLRAAYDFEDGRSASAAAKLGRKQSRKAKDEPEELYDGRLTPSLSARAGKRAKTAHPPHHHHHHHHHAHHHHHETPDQVGSYSMIRFPSNPPSQTPTSNSHRHHHHHHTHSAQHSLNQAQQRVFPSRKPTVSIVSDSVLAAVADKPRRILGSMPYKSTVSQPLPGEDAQEALFESSSAPLPRFEGKENCLFTVRVPRWILSRSIEEISSGDTSHLREICKRRHLWGSDIYTDDSDVIAAAVHAGWIRGDFGMAEQDLQAIDAEDEPQQNGGPARLIFDSRPARPANVPPGYDMHLTLLILPQLQSYAGSHKHHILSRDWIVGKPHDGMSIMIHRMEFVLEGSADRGVGRDAKSRKARIVREELQRQKAMAELATMSSTVKAVPVNTWDGSQHQ